ncbi:hypothetical protein AX14_004972 [Amanita brunnescens Koide BX004]|nr:hypothetical protein AX14_004972 [Amanita brunnescens Koide BX004]
MHSLLSILRILSIAALAITSIVGVSGAHSFYLISRTNGGIDNLLPLRISGGTDGFATLTGDGPIGKFLVVGGNLTAANSQSLSNPFNAFINGSPNGPGCTPDGPLGFQGAQSISSNPCAQTQTFEIWSYSKDKKLGAQLVFNPFLGGTFYACGGDVWYKISRTDSPPGCTPISLWTVPV